MIKRKKYGLRKKDLGINWVVNWLAVDTINGKVYAYHNDPGEPVRDPLSDRWYYSTDSNIYPEMFEYVPMEWCFVGATKVKVVK